MRVWLVGEPVVCCEAKCFACDLVARLDDPDCVSLVWWYVLVVICQASVRFDNDTMAQATATVKDDGSLAYYVWDESSSSAEVKVV